MLRLTAAVAVSLGRLAAASLMHGSLLHLTATSLALFNFAPGIEKRFGRWQFGAIFALSGIAGNLATLAATNHAAVGATGALFGITGVKLYSCSLSSYGVPVKGSRRQAGQPGCHRPCRRRRHQCAVRGHDRCAVLI